MTNRKKLCATIMTVAALTLAGCSSSSSSAVVTTTATATTTAEVTTTAASGELDGTKYIFEGLKNFGFETVLQFDEGKVKKIELEDGKETRSYDGTYRVEGDKITVTIGGGNESGIISEDRGIITIDDGGDGTIYNRR